MTTLFNSNLTTNMNLIVWNLARSEGAATLSETLPEKVNKGAPVCTDLSICGQPS